MRIAFVINTPGQANFWHYPIIQLQERGHAVLVLSRDDGYSSELLKLNQIPFAVYGKIGKTGTAKLAQLPFHFLRSFNIIRKFKPDIILGTGVIEAYSSLFLSKPCIIFEDSETCFFLNLERIQWKNLAQVILTPLNFKLSFGKKHVRFNGYKEIAYLHPKYFKPDPAIYHELRLGEGEKYIILRFNAFDAVHDIGRHGFSFSDKAALVTELEKYARVFISPEGPLSPELEKYRLPIRYNRLHHALYFAQMLVSDTQTMTTEAAVLGTPAVRCNSFVGPADMSNFVELEQKYDSIYSFQKSADAIQKAISLIRQPDLKEKWRPKRQRLLSEKSDVTQFITNFIENYPSSFREYKLQRGVA